MEAGRDAGIMKAQSNPRGGSRLTNAEDHLQKECSGWKCRKHSRQWDIREVTLIHACISSGMRRENCTFGLPGSTIV
jgi:hypothetical protein